MAVKALNRIDDLIGNTPLIKLNVSDKANVYGKLEYTNPGGSVKDRIAKAIIDAGIAEGKINKDTTIIESTSGNTGIGLALIGAAYGLKTIIFLPAGMSVERRKLIQAYGAELRVVDGGVPKANEEAAKLLAETPNSFAPSQFTNPVNVEAHYKTTGPEIWRDTEGDIAAFVAGVGTGGTLTGAGKFLKEQDPSVKAYAIEPEESRVLEGGPNGAHKIQGIMPGFVPDVLDQDIYDEIIHVSSAEAFEYQKKLGAEQGIFVGISSGAAAAAGAKLAERPEFAGKNIVVILPDTGERYLSMLNYDD
ncbi:MAG: cysteine synthase A [Eggerthellaceae bacterium]|jgi:cysteine synthase A